MFFNVSLGSFFSKTQIKTKIDILVKQGQNSAPEFQISECGLDSQVTPRLMSPARRTTQSSPRERTTAP